MVKIVIGCGENKNVLLAKEALIKNKDLEIKLVYSDNDLIIAMEDKNVDAVVRGSLKSSNIVKNIKNLNKGKSINRASFIKFKNESHRNNVDLSYNGFLLGPVGIDEGNNINEKFELTVQAVKFILKMNKIPKIAILAGGRKEDFGRNYEIDRSIEESEKLLKKIINFFSLNKSNFKGNSSKNNLKNSYTDLDNEFRSLDKISIKNYYILFEKAIADKNNIIIAPDGLIGNIIFRSLVLINSWESFGAIALGSEKVFIDTSRDQSIDGYIRALKFAYRLVNNDFDQ